jgi:thiol-disulfide isomerase/thioredoxin
MTMNRAAIWGAVLACSALLGACDDDNDPAGFCPPGETCMNNGQPDAAAPATDQYPPGPFGNRVGGIIKDLSWQGYADSDGNADTMPFTEPVRDVFLKEFFQGNDPDAKIVVIMGSANWCGPCHIEAAELAKDAKSLMTRGARLVTAIIESEGGQKATTEDAKAFANWRKAPAEHIVPWAVVADPQTKVFEYAEAEQNGIPFIIFIDAKTMEIVYTQSGAGDSVENLIEYYLNK